jgi:hypothetical protein
MSLALSRHAMARFRLVTVALMCFVGILPCARTVHAQGVMPQRVDFLKQADEQPLFSSYARMTFRSLEPEQAPAPRVPGLPQIPLAPVVPHLPKAGSKGLLNSLYVTTVAMQALDIHSTLQAMSSGAVEGNPIMSKVAGNPGAFIATKAAVAAVSVWAAHKMSKRNKAAAVVTLVAVNSAYAMIVGNNYRLAHR